MEHQEQIDRHQPTEEEKEAVANLIDRIYHGPFNHYDESGRGAVGVYRFDRVQDVPNDLIVKLRRMPHEILTEHAVGDFGYVLFVRFDNGEPADFCFYLTRRLVDEIHPTN